MTLWRNECVGNAYAIRQGVRHLKSSWFHKAVFKDLILCFVDRAYRYNFCKEKPTDAQLILSIFRQPLHVSGISRPIIRRYNCMYTTIGTYYSLRMTVCCPGWIGKIQPGQQTALMTGLDTPETCRGWRNILRISCASSWFFFTAKPNLSVKVLFSKRIAVQVESRIWTAN
jgi:hypothetical protein